jgi:hypothetical protein
MNLKKVSNYIESLNTTSAQKAVFLAAADYMLICAALSNPGSIIVTDEKYSPSFDANNNEKIQIPNVCKYFNIEYLNTFDFMRKESIK